MLKENYHVAVPTAFRADESLDVDATCEHILGLIKQGVKSVLVSGSTGEQHSMTVEEKIHLLHALDAQYFPADVEILFGLAAIRQKDLLDLAVEIEQTKSVTAILLGFPPYIVPSQAEAIAYVERVLDVTKKPIVLYNNPRRTGFDLAVESINQLLEHPAIIGIKEAGNPDKVKDYQLPKDRLVRIYAGGESGLAENVTLGFQSLSSIAGNLYPQEIKAWFEKLLAGKLQEMPFKEELAFLDEASPLPTLKRKISEKTAVNLGICRSPLGNEPNTPRMEEQCESRKNY